MGKITEGGKARRAGKSTWDNPHKEGSKAHERWLHEFNTAFSKESVHVTPFVGKALEMFKHMQNQGRAVSMRRQECNARIWEVRGA